MSAINVLARAVASDFRINTHSQTLYAVRILKPERLTLARYQKISRAIPSVIDKCECGLTRMFTQHKAALRSFFSRRGANEDAEDLVQETYLRLLHANQRAGDRIDNQEAYLYTVALNLAREQASKRRILPVQGMDFEDAIARIPSNDGLVEEDMQRSQCRKLLDDALHKLPVHTRSVLEMQYRDDLSYQQIAERLGVSTHMVKKHVVSGLAICRALLAVHMMIG
jgi:RNA polymerase sigma factor (sigma-70 family)